MILHRYTNLLIFSFNLILTLEFFEYGEQENLNDDINHEKFNKILSSYLQNKKRTRYSQAEKDKFAENDLPKDLPEDLKIAHYDVENDDVNYKIKCVTGKDKDCKSIDFDEKERGFLRQNMKILENEYENRKKMNQKQHISNSLNSVGLYNDKNDNQPKSSKLFEGASSDYPITPMQNTAVMASQAAGIFGIGSM